jgi:ADP-ribose pyrophosphatase YjhB (NUDIX family)
VPLLIDAPRWPAHGRLWSHLISDTSFVELHAFAELVGLPARSFEGDHYDVPAERFEAVLAAGARAVSMRELVTALHASGLRRPKRKGERVLASTFVPDVGSSTGGRLDLLASALPAPVTPTRVDVLLLRRRAGTPRPSLLLVHDERAGAAWSLPGTTLTAADRLEQAAVHAVSQQTGVHLDPTQLTICGHTHAVGDDPSWTTYVTTTLAHAAAPRARWLPTGAAPAEVVASPWWPLVDWLLDRRQPRTPA